MKIRRLIITIVTSIAVLMAAPIGTAQAGPKPWGPSSSYSPPWMEREYICVERFRLFWFQDVTYVCYVLDAP